jgi:hypothetical protein
MNTLYEALQDYIAMRRALGFKLLDAAPALSDFVAFLERKRKSHITIRLALKWAQKPGARPERWAHRLAFVRGLARYRSATDPRTEIPPWSLLPFRSRRAQPYLYPVPERRGPSRRRLNRPRDEIWQVALGSPQRFGERNAFEIQVASKSVPRWPTGF